MFNINEFTVIILRRFEGKKWTQKKLLQPLPASASPSLVFQCLFCFSALFFSGQRFSPFFCSPFPVPPFSSFCFLVQPLFLFFLVHVLPFFSPKTFLNPKHFSVQPKTFFSSAQNLFFSPKRFCFKSPTCCSFKFSPPFFFVRASFSVSCQLLRP